MFMISDENVFSRAISREVDKMWIKVEELPHFLISVVTHNLSSELIAYKASIFNYISNRKQTDVQ